MASAHSASAARFDESALISRALQRDQAALREIIRLHNRRLYRVARSILGNDDEAEDALQETYLRAFVALGGFRGQSSLSTWLTRIAVNEALSRLKARQRPSIVPIDQVDARVIAFPKLISEAPDPERAMAQQEIVKLIEKAIDKLPRDFRVVLVARVIEGMSVEETASVLGVRAETVKTRLNRARALLRKDLAGQVEGLSLDAFPFAGKRCQNLADRVLSRLA